MGNMRATAVLLAVFVFGLTAAQSLEYICNNATSEGEFEVTLLLNQHYGINCDQTTPRWTNQFGQNLIEWGSNVSPSFNLNFRIIDTCGSPLLATKFIMESVPYSQIDTSTGSVNRVCTRERTSTNIGFISETQPTSTEVLMLLSDAELPLISTSDSFVKRNSINQRNIRSSGYAIERTLEMMALFMIELQWDYITVIYSNDALGRESLEAFHNISRKHHICTAEEIPVTYKDSPSISSTGVVYLGSEGIGLHIMENRKAGNVWVTSFDVTGLTSTNDEIYSVLRAEGDPLTNAIISLGDALKAAADASNTDCPDQNGVKRCSTDNTFRNKIVENLNSTFDVNKNYTVDNSGNVVSENSVQDKTYNIYRYSGSGANDQVHMALLSTNGSFSLLEDESLPPAHSSLCNTGVVDCRGKCGFLNDEDHTYIHGDWMILVSVLVEKKGDPDDRWSCKELLNRTLFRTEAITYALLHLKKELNDDNIGMLIVESCGDKLKTTGSVYDLIRGHKKICNRQNQCFDPKKVVAFIGDGRSSVTQQLQNLLKEIPIIQISYGASSVTLNDRTAFPYFLRTIPPDDLQSHFMVELLEKIRSGGGSTINSVSLVYSDDLYGKSAAKRVVSSLKDAKICVHINRTISESGKNDYGEIIQDIIDNSQNVKIIILILDPAHLLDFMNTIQDNISFRNAWVRIGFTLILSDSWNDGKRLLDRFGELAKGSFSFKIDSDFNSTMYESYIKSVDLPQVTNRNPWLSTLRQEAGRCKIRGNFRSAFSTPCVSGGTDLTQFVGEAYSWHLMKAMTATVYGLRSIGHDNDVNTLFDPKSIKERYEKMLEVEIDNTLEGKSRMYKTFTQRTPGSDTYGNGRSGYTIFNIKLRDGKPEYVRVHKTGSGFQDKLGEFMAGPEFYLGNGGVTTDLDSTSETCNNASIISTEDKPDSGGSTGQATLLIAVAVVCGFIALILLAAVILFFILKFRKPKRKGRYADRPVPEIPQELPGGPMDELPTYDQIPYSQLMSEMQREEILKFVAQNPGSALPSYLNMPLQNCYYNGTSGGASAYNQSQNGFRAPQASTAIIDNPTFGPDSGDSRELFTVIDCSLESNGAPGNNSPAPKPAPRKTVNTHGLSDDEASGGNVSRSTDPNSTLPKDYANGKLFVSMSE